ncbi:putative transmembrane and coiled-coil domain-containing protein 3-like [Apostichopus japonicus]|uniref:Putative transmembrane and coiled-coil domain-containing protein 3-like n=1 Tax=Stichopus japonicus TaxID=307972 RepID=A0A2G8JPV7_STIJA|nr:putative transmembrane and coiled-coil domain-containing protein 3-like [Apostichopus japonicus]
MSFPKSFFLIVVAITAVVIPASGANGKQVPKQNKDMSPLKRKNDQQFSSNQMMYWLTHSCHHLVTLIHTKSKVIRKLEQSIEKVKSERDLTQEMRAFQIHTFEIFKKELNESENSIFTSIASLKRALTGNYKDVNNMKESSLERLEALKIATLKEEQEYNDLLAVEKLQLQYQEHLKMANSSHNKLEAMLDEVLEEVAVAADKLESGILEHAFDQSKKIEGSNIEAVIRLQEMSRFSRSNRSETEEQREMSILVDTNNNQYILTKPKDTTMPLEDHHLLWDIILVVVLAVAIGWLCVAIGLPAMFGYIIAGVLVGSDGFNLVKAVVQIETIGEFGAFLILFSVGLEFSPEKIRKVWRVSVIGSLSLSVIMILFCVLCGSFLYITPRHSAFVAACLSLSSTPLVVKFLSSSGIKREMAKDVEEAGSTMVGILVMQDVQLGLLIAILPSLADAEIDPTSHLKSVSSLMALFNLLKTLVQLAAALAAAVLVSFLLCKLVLPKMISHLKATGSKEIQVLAAVALALVMLTVTDALGISMELGCFLAGVMLSIVGQEEIITLVGPIRDFLGCIFFTSIGLHIFPTFVAYELTILLRLTISVVLIKFMTVLFVIGRLLPQGNHNIRWVVSAGLAQVSEFSFVLGSRGRRLGLLSREVYLLILSITTLSLCLAPILWKVTLWQRHRISNRAAPLSPSSQRENRAFNAMPLPSERTHPETVLKVE